MTMEMDNSGVSVGGDAYAGTRSEQPAQSESVAPPPSADAGPDGHAEAAEEITLDFDYDGTYRASRHRHRTASTAR
jgi:hypothetical protein